jgi:hypothetical protein
LKAPGFHWLRASAFRFRNGRQQDFFTGRLLRSEIREDSRNSRLPTILSVSIRVHPRLSIPVFLLRSLSFASVKIRVHPWVRIQAFASVFGFMSKAITCAHGLDYQSLIREKFHKLSCPAPSGPLIFASDERGDSFAALHGRLVLEP